MRMPVFPWPSLLILFSLFGILCPLFNKLRTNMNPGANAGAVVGEMNLNDDDDSVFLLYFIMGTYFGPDIENEKPRKSALQRVADGLSPYTSDHLGGSNMTVAEVEQIYYFLVRNACQSAILKSPLLRQFFQGKIPSQGRAASATNRYPPLPALFPPHLHPLSLSLNGTRIIENIVYIENPQLYYLKQEDIERFKRLTGLTSFFVPRTAARSKDCFLGEKLHGLTASRGARKKRRSGDDLGPQVPLCDPQVGKDGTNNKKPKADQRGLLALQPPQLDLGCEDKEGPAMAVLHSQPSKQELDRIMSSVRNAYVVTGSAVKGQVGPVLGLMDMGEREDSYLFRIALPGVKRHDRAFRCEVDSDGQVVIKGDTVTGEKIVYHYNEAFVMQTQNLCPPGPFSITFQLPGPVDPQQFTGSYGTDGILEGIIKKRKQLKPPG